jgi:hypothetical protein
MAENLTQAQLLELDQAVCDDPDNANPNYERGKPGGTIYMLKKSARNKRKAIGWAIYYQKQPGFYEGGG